jgi:hypothetical protein
VIGRGNFVLHAAVFQGCQRATLPPRLHGRHVAVVAYHSRGGRSEGIYGSSSNQQRSGVPFISPLIQRRRRKLERLGGCSANAERQREGLGFWLDVLLMGWAYEFSGPFALVVSTVHASWVGQSRAFANAAPSRIVERVVCGEPSMLVINIPLVLRNRLDLTLTK